MAVNIFPAPSSGKSENFQQFTTSGTWTCPDGVNIVEVLAVGAGGGGGGGGAGGSNQYYNGNTSVGGDGGGGGGGGEVVRRFVSVVPGTTYTVTVGAGGTGGQLAGSLTTEAWNLITNPQFESATTTGWSASVGSISGTTTNTPATGTYCMNLTTLGSNLTFAYDTGQISGVNFQTGIKPFFTGTFKMPGTATSMSVTPSFTYYNSSNSVIGTDTGVSAWTMSANTNWQSFNRTGSVVVPTGTTRVVITLTCMGAPNNTQVYVDMMLFNPQGDSQYFGYSGNNQYYLDPGQWGALGWWSGTANASYSMRYRYAAGCGAPRYYSPNRQWSTSFSGAAGAGGGSTTFGSLLTALGGQGGYGGCSGGYHSSTSGSVVWANYVNGAYQCTTNFPTSGLYACGGGGGGYSASAYNGFNGGGGGSMAGWAPPYIRVNQSAAATYYQFDKSATATNGSFYRGWGGQNTGMSGTAQALNYSSGPTPTYPYQAGGDGTDGYGYGGGGGQSGNGNSVPGNYTATTSGSPVAVLDPSYVIAANGGTGGAVGAAATTGPAGYQGGGFHGGNGGNGVSYGSGGGGGGGGGAGMPNSVTQFDQNTTIGGNGGSGGNGANGYCLVRWVA